MADSNHTYQRRINSVVNYINQNLSKSFTLEELSKIAHFSPFHFHRIFVAVVGETLASYTNRIRAEKSAKLLKYSSQRIGDIAFECGYSSPATFARSFKSYFNVAPSQFRKSGNIENSKICKELHPMQKYFCNMTLEEKKSKFPITIKKLPQRKVAYIRVVDSYKEGAVIRAFEELISWAERKNIFSKGQFFGMSLDDPMITPEDKYRYEACLIVPNRIEVDTTDAIQTMQLPPCRYATTKVSGDIKLVATAMGYMFNDWLINNPYEPDHQYGLEYFLDNENICNWDHFDLELHIPVKPLINY